MIEDNARKYLFDLDDCMRRVGLKYMLYGGTCLGAVRDKAFIPVDQDIDTASLDEDWQDKYKILHLELLKSGFKVDVIDHRHKREWTGGCYALKGFKYGEHGDINSFTRYKSYRYQPSHASDFVLCHKAEHLEETTTIEFYGREFNIPKNYDAFLKEKYDDWRTPHTRFHNVSKPTCRKEGDDFWLL